MNPDILTEKLQEILQRAITVAQENHHSEVTSAHIISAMCEDDILDGIFERVHVDKQAVYPHELFQRYYRVYHFRPLRK